MRRRRRGRPASGRRQGARERRKRGRGTQEGVPPGEESRETQERHADGTRGATGGVRTARLAAQLLTFNPRNRCTTKDTRERQPGNNTGQEEMMREKKGHARAKQADGRKGGGGSDAPRKERSGNRRAADPGDAMMKKRQPGKDTQQQRQQGKAAE
jgi:hypothetical protein